MDVEVAPAAADPLCAEVLVRLRGLDPLGGVGERRGTSSQSTAAWGDPAVVLRCGVEPPGPTTETCRDIDGTDWVARESAGGTVYTTYGREPAVAVTLPELGGGLELGDAVLGELGPAVSVLPQTRECL